MKRLRIRAKMLLVIALIIFMTGAVVFGFMYQVYRTSEVKLLSKTVMQAAALETSSINGDLIEQYIQTGEKDEFFEEMYQGLLEAAELCGLEYIYVMYDYDPENYCYVVSVQPGSEDDGFMDVETKEIYTEETVDALEEGIITSTDVYSSEGYGDMISAFAPVKNSNGEIVAVLGADGMADALLAESHEAMQMIFVALIIAIVVLVALIFAVSAIVIQRMLIRPIHQIKEAAENIVRGDIQTPITYHSEDELGDLANSFRSVAQVLNQVEGSMESLCRLTIEGRIRDRMQVDESIHGAYRRIVNDVYRILETMVDHFDNLPVGVEIIGSQMETLFANRMVDTLASIHPDNVTKQETAFTDDSGRAIGTLIVSIDQTEVHAAQQEARRQTEIAMQQMKKAEKRAVYQDNEVKYLIEAIEKLAGGDLDIVLAHSPYDEDTKDIHENFSRIGNSLTTSCTNIRSYIDELADILSNIESKNLAIGIEREYLGDFSQLKTSTNNIIDTLNEVFEEFLRAAEQVEVGAEQTTRVAQTLAQGSSEQANSIDQINTTVALISSQTKANAENAKEADRISDDTKDDAQTGNDQMREMINAMEGIKEASKGIAGIIKVIEDIAFQTNILALNAAVEAARAGEQGKGFAVVAEEVRTLAGKSAEAAKGTTEMIENSLHKVEAGVAIADKTNVALGKIAEGVASTADIVSTISEASRQQAEAISQIETGIKQVTDVTHSNTAASEESASASEEMSGQAQTLKSLINAFQLKRSGGAVRLALPEKSSWQTN